MRQVIFVAGLWLAMILQPAAVAQPGPQQPSAEAVEAARAAVAGTDFSRVLQDRASATEALRHLDLLASAPGIYAEIGRSIETLRLFPLISLERNDEIRATLDRVLAMRPDQAAEYGGPVLAALSLQDHRRFAAVVDAASRNVRASGWAELRGLLERDFVWPALNWLRQNDRPARVRLADALFRIGWQSHEADTGDRLRMILLTDALERGDRAAARDYAAGITSPSTLAPLLILRRYDGLLPDTGDRLAPLRGALEERERATAELVARDGESLVFRLDRMQHLRAVGRGAEALALGQPQLRDPNASAAADENGMWIVNEAAYALLEAGRPAEAARLLAGLTSLPMERHGYLISSMINHGEILVQADRPAEALEHARRLERDFARYASDYGNMWIRATIVCALARLDRGAEAAPTLATMRAAETANPAALTRAYLCVNDLDAAERLIITRLGSDEPEEAVMALQTYGLDRTPGALEARLLAVRERPAVRAALDRVARLVELPLARTYWGGF